MKSINKLIYLTIIILYAILGGMSEGLTVQLEALVQLLLVYQQFINLNI